ncbi:MAG: histone deacetylase [Planctomycetes bacterium]|nr:histone deacetylase [Planctomycetota bacterium]
MGDAVRTGFVYDERYLDHKPGRFHPERPERVRAIAEGLREEKLLETLVRIPARFAEVEEIEAAHDPAYVRIAREVCASGATSLPTGDTDISRESYEIARLAAGGVLAAVDAIAAGKVRNAFCAVRPPGHHATRSRGMGFCVFNNVAVGVRYAQRKHGWKRILIADWDIHHGNGTQDIFEADPDVLYFSVHRYPFYPGTGARGETGVGAGKGTVINVPLDAGADGGDFLRAFREELLPAADRFRPDFVLVSVGFDPHRDDPLGGGPWGMQLETKDFADLARLVRGIADRHAAGRLVAVLEGGYDLEALADGTAAVIRVLQEPPPAPAKAPAPGARRPG